MNPALWDLGKHPTTFDFAAFATIAGTMGHDHVREVLHVPAKRGWPLGKPRK